MGSQTLVVDLGIFIVLAARMTERETCPEVFKKLNVFNRKDRPLFLDYFLSTFAVLELSSFY